MTPRDPVQFTGIDNDDPSNPMGCAGMIDKWIGISGITGGSAIVEWSADGGTTWEPLVDAAGDTLTFTVDGQILEVPQPVPWLRINPASMTGTVVFWFFRAQP